MTFSTALFILGILLIAIVVQQRNSEHLQEQRRRALQIADIDRMDGIAFEHYVSKLLQQQGYATRITPSSNDFGADIIATRGGSNCAVQVKRYSKSVPRTAISDAVAAMKHYDCVEAMVITNNYFTRNARLFAQSLNCQLIEREQLADWIRQYQQRGNCESTGFWDTLAREDVGGSKAEVQTDLTALQEETSGEPILRLTAEACTVPVLNDSSGRLMAGILAKAVADWPNDYTMQEHIIDEQLASYRWVCGYHSDDLDPEMLSRIKAFAAAEWADDYTMQQHTIQEQVASYQRIRKIAPYRWFA
jgi:restriction system protein